MNIALRTRSPALRDVFALDLTAGRSDATHLRQALLSGEAPQLRASQVASAASLGAIWAASAEDIQTVSAGFLLTREVVNQHGGERLSKQQRQIFAQVAYVLGEYDEVERALREFDDLSPTVRAGLAIDLLHPKRGAASFVEWQEAFSSRLTAAGLTPVQVRTDQNTMFDGLSARPSEKVDGPLVTVLMPCYRPDEGLLTSVKSIVAQTYTNLEVFLIDDDSGPAYEPLFEQAVGVDERIKILQMQQNGGPYVARNAALEHATGEYVTVQDADDWSHPSRIEHQVQLLLEHPHAGGSRSDAIRAKDDLTQQWIGYSPRRPNASSLMFRRTDLERTGPFDHVRKGADSEFHERLIKMVGPVLDTGTPLAITRLRSGTLSRSDFAYGWQHPARELYRFSYRSWHREIDDAEKPGYRITEGRRPFPAPFSFVKPKAGREGRQYFDLLCVMDASDQRAAGRALELAVRESGRSVGVLHLENVILGRRSRPLPDECLLQAARRGLITLVASSDDLEVRTTVLLEPSVMELSPNITGTLNTKRVLAIAPLPEQGKPVTDLQTVNDEVELLFGMRPIWCAHDEVARRAWANDGWQLRTLQVEAAWARTNDLRVEN